MSLGMEVGLGPGHIVLDRDPAHPPPSKRGHIPIGVNPAGDTGDVSPPPENWTAGDGNALRPPKFSF